MKEVKVIAPIKDEGSFDKNLKDLPKRRVAAYARVSTGSEEQASSFENQVNYWKKWVADQKDCELVEVYADQGKSGTSLKKRVSFNKMIDDAMDGKIDLIVCKSISRFARNTLDSIATVRRLKSIGVEVYFDNEHLWSLKEHSEFTLTVLSSMAQEESRHISENVTWTFRKKMKEGKPFVNTSRFLGYDKKSKRTSANAGKKMSEYGLQLREKQKAKFIYGVLEKPFRNYYDRADRMKGQTGSNLMTILETRLDNVIFRMGFARTRREARQVVLHKFITVNGKVINVPSYLIKAGDVIEVKEAAKNIQRFKDISEITASRLVPEWLDVNKEGLKGTIKELPSREVIDVPVDEMLIVELYSK